MQDYKTVIEIAADWNVTSRHVQFLCRQGRVDGAVKRAGSWFIPGDTPIPVKNTKLGFKGFRFVGTKKKIFDSAIELFMTKGFNDVSIRDIATRVGIRQSTVYNHFGSKQEILDTIYDFYCYYYLRNRPSLKDMETILQHGSVMEVIWGVRYEFEEDYKQTMSDITKIIFQRISVDDRAREIGKSLMVDEGVEYVENIFNIAIEIGRLAPFDTHAAAVFINSVRIFTLYNWIIDPSPDNMMKLADDEQTLYTYAAGNIKDLTPPVIIGKP